MLLSVIELGNCNPVDVQKQAQMGKIESGKALVVYFSWGGNTRTIAEQMAEITGARVFEFLPCGILYPG